ncbi:Uncharacterised protein [Mycobacteroides abscessus subsp. abscessus]|nr:Uncharacterised protein [Mycobacteroides abscessus subsp. abscessus]
MPSINDFTTDVVCCCLSVNACSILSATPLTAADDSRNVPRSRSNRELLCW